MRPMLPPTGDAVDAVDDAAYGSEAAQEAFAGGSSTNSRPGYDVV